MKKIRRLYYLGAVALICALFCSCRPKPKVLSKDKLVAYLEHNPELSQTQEVQGIKVQVKYHPSQLLVLQEFGDNNKVSKEKLAELEKKYGSQYYFSLLVSKDNKEVIRQLGSFSRYSDMLQVFSFELGKYINASTEKNDTAYLVDYAFEQDYGMSTANRALLSFDKNKLHDTENINLNIAEFGLGIGNLRFAFKRSDLDKVPLLNFNQSD